MIWLKRIIPYLIIIAFALYACAPLLQPGLYTMHDDEQIGRLFDLNSSLLSGHIPPRIVPNLGFGYGYPFFNFYPPLAYYMGEVFVLLGFGYIVSTKLMLVSVFVSSAIFMYLFSKQFLGRLGGIVSSIAYTFASYRALDVYVRGAFAEASTFPFIPLLFWAIYKMYKKPSFVYALISALAWGALILGHNLIAIMTLPFAGVWVLYLLYISKKKMQFIKNTVLAVLLGFGLTAYFWLPSYFERDYTLINILTSELANYALHFVCTYQLWDSMWGYGGSILGCYDGISFEIGKVQLVSSVGAFLFASFYLFKHKITDKILPILIFFSFLVLCVFLMTKFSKPLWDMIQPLWYIQFPWRFLLIASFVSAFLTGALVSFVRPVYARVLLSAVLVGGILFLSLGRFTPQQFINVNDEFYTNEKKIRWETSSLAYEYVPSGIQTKTSEIGTTKIDIVEQEIASRSSEVIAGQMEVSELENKPHVKKFNIIVNSPGILQLNTFDFPGWEVVVDGKPVSYSSDNKLKLIRINLEQGSHMLEAYFKNTAVRTIGNSLTGISILVVGIISVIVFLKRFKK